jgi:hypothetical protein
MAWAFPPDALRFPCQSQLLAAAGGINTSRIAEFADPRAGCTVSILFCRPKGLVTTRYSKFGHHRSHTRLEAITIGLRIAKVDDVFLVKMC